MKLKLQLQTHQSNAQLKIQVFVMIQCWLFEMLETADRMTHCHIAEDLLFSSVTVTSSDDIVNSQLCRAQPLDMHVKCRSGLGIIYQTLIQFILSSVTGQTYVCVCVDFPDHIKTFTVQKMELGCVKNTRLPCLLLSHVRFRMPTMSQHHCLMESGSGCCYLTVGFHPLLGLVVTHRITCFLDFVHGWVVVHTQHISETVSKTLCSLNNEPESRNQVLTYHHQTLV